MSPLDEEDTGQLKLLAAQLHRLEHDPRRPGLIDVVFLTVGVGSLLVTTVCWLSLVIAPDHYPLDAGRVILTSGVGASIIAAVFLGVFALNRANRNRTSAVMEKMAKLAGKLHTDSLTRAVELATGLEEVKVGLEMLAGQLSRVEGKLIERGEFDPPTDPKDIAMRSFETGRRIGRREAEG